jgi:hypothetical protein
MQRLLIAVLKRGPGEKAVHEILLDKFVRKLMFMSYNMQNICGAEFQGVELLLL